MPSMIIERIGSCNDCNLCAERRVVIPVALLCGVGLTTGIATASGQYRICTIKFRIKSWDFPSDIPGLMKSQLKGRGFVGNAVIAADIKTQTLLNVPM